MLKLNLGCGIFYKPGYINMDLEEKEIADKILDVSSLPYEDNSVDVIEASHIIEHFDIIHIPYILAEWYRVLKLGGKLFIETPNLSKSIRKLRFRNYRKQIVTMKYLFGVDYLQNIHKMGFTSSFLRKSLSKTGFTKIRKKRQRSFKSERGLRVVAQKPESIEFFEKKHFITTLRTKIFSQLEKPEPQFLDTIENNCINNIHNLPNRLDEFFTFETIVFYCSSFITINPILGYIFLSMFSDETIQKINTKTIDFFKEIKLHALLMTCWIRSKKNPLRLMYSISSFYSHWVNKIQLSLTKEKDCKNMFTYLLSLEKESTNFFSFDAVNLMSQRIGNQGIKEFSNGNYKEAEKLLKHSLRVDPANVVSNLNLARLLRILDGNLEEILGFYDISRKYMTNKNGRKFIRKEVNETRKKKDAIKQPIQYRF